MLMPILRLVLIYLVLTLAVVGVFKRDNLMRLVAGDLPAAETPAPMPRPAVAAPAAPAPSPAQPATPVAAPTPAVQPATQPDTVTEADLATAINAARAAYWAGDIAGARAQLIALAGAHPDNPDLKGELGNLHFSQRDYPAAATAYLEAANLLIAQDQFARAGGLLPVLRQIDPGKAETLAARLQNR
ncbi:hypothetical protein [Maritimibacter fusiformis]|uniref:Tetratricopeptide repeat protein n=1 Tax=Maritimibacter fusiformis TaxID=2603819 RepID=A0A5D0RLI1_9RHOB|nr:hypothetical protein [Maritimibacter fusiformis]TYB81394.1 hypothetical protein FVF75_09795 [Maritimibacter fusiformis]